MSDLEIIKAALRAVAQDYLSGHPNNTSYAISSALDFVADEIEKLASHNTTETT